jgi:lysine-specific demethylase 3
MKVRNLKSSLKVAMDFVSPEGIMESLEQSQRIRKLPEGHFAKEDKLQAQAMLIASALAAVEILDNETTAPKRRAVC